MTQQNRKQIKPLQPKLQLATDYYIKNNVINGDKTYTYHKAMAEAEYKPSYILRFAPKISQNIIVKQQIDLVRQRLNAAIVRKVVLTREKQISELDRIKDLAEKDGNLDAMVACIKEQNVLTGLRIADAPADSEEAERLTLERKRMSAVFARLYIESKAVDNSPKLLNAGNSASQDAAGLTNDVKSDAKDGENDKVV